MREVAVICVGLHKFGRFPDKSVKDLGREAIENALKDSGAPFKDIQAAYVGHVYQPMGTGADVVTQFGQTGIPVTNMEVACTSSSTIVSGKPERKRILSPSYHPPSLE